MFVFMSRGATRFSLTQVGTVHIITTSPKLCTVFRTFAPNVRCYEENSVLPTLSKDDVLAAMDALLRWPAAQRAKRAGWCVCACVRG